MNGYVVDNVACGGCHTLLTAIKGSNADFTNNDFSLLSEQSRPITLTELPPLQKIPGPVMNKSTELPHSIEDVTNLNKDALPNPETTNENHINCEDTNSMDSLEANVSGSHIVNINDLENENGSEHGITDINRDDDDNMGSKQQIAVIIAAAEKIGDEATATISEINLAGSKPNVEIIEEAIIKKIEPIDPGHNCDKGLGIPAKLTEVANSPPPKSPILHELLHVPDITQMSPDRSRQSDDGQKSESGSKSENETIPCGSDHTSPQAEKTSKTQAVLPILRNEDIINSTVENMHSEEAEVVVQKLQEKGRFAKMFQSIRDKENSCMGKGKVIEDTVVGTYFLVSLYT